MTYQTKLRHTLKQIIQIIVLFLIISLTVDYWRAPTPPVAFEQTPFTTLQQHTTTLAQLSEKQIVVLYFWGTWCGICRHTSPVIQDLQQSGVPVLGVALRSGSDGEVRDYLSKHALSFDNLNDAQGTWSAQWKIKVTPTIVLIKNGKVVHNSTGLMSKWGLKTRLLWANWVN